MRFYYIFIVLLTLYVSHKLIFYAISAINIAVRKWWDIIQVTNSRRHSKNKSASEVKFVRKQIQLNIKLCISSYLANSSNSCTMRTLAIVRVECLYLAELRRTMSHC